MKDLKSRLINEGTSGWKMAGNAGGQDFSWSPAAEYLWFNTEGEQLGFITKKNIKEWADDFDDVDELLNLKPGELYDADGGINYYVRIK